MANSTLGKDIIVTTHTYTTAVAGNSWASLQVGLPFTEDGAPNSSNYNFCGGCASVNHGYGMATYNHGDGAVWVENHYNQSQTFDVIVTRIYHK